MLKLNKKGWGTMEMLILSGCLLVALIVAIYFISQLYGNLELSVSNNEYVDLENRIEMAAKEFVDNNNIEVEGQYKLNLSTLKNSGFINKLEDSNGYSCNGYVIVTNIDNINHYKGYVLCNDYQTNNY